MESASGRSPRHAAAKTSGSQAGENRGEWSHSEGNVTGAARHSAAGGGEEQQQEDEWKTKEGGGNIANAPFAHRFDSPKRGRHHLRSRARRGSSWSTRACTETPISGRMSCLQGARRWHGRLIDSRLSRSGWCSHGWPSEGRHDIQIRATVCARSPLRACRRRGLGGPYGLTAPNGYG